MSSRFDTVPELYGRTNRQNCYINIARHVTCVKQELSYRKQIARQLRTQYVAGILTP